MSNKIQVVDDVATDNSEAVRTSADRISREGRRARREFNGTTRHFYLDPRVVEDLSKEGHLCFINDDGKGHLQEVESWGYRYVTNREAYGNREGLEPNDKVCIRYGTRDDKGNPQDVYLMLQPWEFYEDDMARIDEANTMVDQNIRTEGKDQDHGYGHRVVYDTHRRSKV